MAWQADLLFHIAMGTENCLHLSVYTLDIKPPVLKPVMVWIHGIHLSSNDEVLQIFVFQQHLF